MVWRRLEELGCDAVQERLEALVEGDLGPAEREVVESHCRLCAACGLERVRAEALRSALRDLPVLDPPSELLDRVRQAAAAEARFRWRPEWSAAAVAVAAAMLLAVGVALMRPAVGLVPGPQVHRARAEARYAFAVVADACRRAGTLTRREVVLKRIVTPSAGALHRLLPGRLVAGRAAGLPSPAYGG